MKRYGGQAVVRIGRAIAKMRHEGVNEEQAIAKAYAMEDKGHLRPDGTYIPVKGGGTHR